MAGRYTVYKRGLRTSRKHFMNLDDALVYYDKACSHNPEDYEIFLYDNWAKGRQLMYENHMTELVRLNFPEVYRNVAKKKKAEPHPFGL